MVWTLLVVSLFVLLIVNGAVHQLRVVLFNDLRAELAEKRRQDVEQQKRVAADKIRDMLAEKRELISITGHDGGQAQTATEPASHEAPAKSRAAAPAREPVVARS